MEDPGKFYVYFFAERPFCAPCIGAGRCAGDCVAEYGNIIFINQKNHNLMDAENRIAAWVASYKALAEKIIAYQVKAMQDEFPDERFPVRPLYRRAMYQRLMLIV